MPRYFYTTSQEAQAISTAVDLLFCTVAADVPVGIWGLDLGQTSDLGDANEEVLRIGIYSGVTGGGSGSALTEVAVDDRGPTASAAWVGQGTASTSGTLRETIYWNIRQAGPVYVAQHEDAVVHISASNDPIAFRLLAAPTDAITLSCKVLWAED